MHRKRKTRVEQTESWALQTKQNKTKKKKKNWMGALVCIVYMILIDCFTSRSKIFHLHGDVTITCEELQNLGLCLALRAFVQGGIFIVPHLL
jgi:hypothetical protein